MVSLMLECMGRQAIRIPVSISCASAALCNPTDAALPCSVFDKYLSGVIVFYPPVL